MQREPGPLRNGNPRGDPNAAPRCGARTRAGGACRAPAMANGRCRMHGGCSTGPRTAEGLARLRAAHTVHGCLGAEGRAFRIGIRNLLVRHRLLQDLARLPGFGRNLDDLRPFLRPIYPAPVPRRRRKPVVKPHAT
ncbi:MAG TPA: HGGxSTG domain-containing protein [Acetobacteraceae bacterium]|nr:HGGxSTG domain-containing protein [Acetobacteraceae bacterium]